MNAYKIVEAATRGWWIGREEAGTDGIPPEYVR